MYTLVEPTESKVAVTPVASLRVMNPLASLNYPVLSDASLAFNLHFAIEARAENASAIYVSIFVEYLDLAYVYICASYKGVAVCS